MSVCVAAAASFLTPVATPVNLMVMGPGGYRFGDYWKLGICCMAWFFVVARVLRAADLGLLIARAARAPACAARDPAAVR